MANGVIHGVRIAGVAAAVPANIARNLDFELLAEADRQRLVKTTGIRERRVAPDGMCASDLCHAAAARLLADLGWAQSSVEALIFVSQTPDYRLPATAVTLQHRLGLAKSALAFDINLGCSGYVYGLSSVAALLRGMGLQRALLLVGDLATRTNSQRDRTAGPLFGDAGTATALLADVGAPPLFFSLFSDGAGKNAILMPGGGYRHPLKAADLELREVAEGVSRSAEHAIIDGASVFNFTLREVPGAVREVLARSGKKIDEVDLFIFHQANQMMNEQIRRKLGIPVDRHPYSLDRFGNTSCATLPLTIVTEARERLRSGAANVLFAGFGVGLSWGCVLASLDRIVCPDLIEL